MALILLQNFEEPEEEAEVAFEDEEAAKSEEQETPEDDEPEAAEEEKVEVKPASAKVLPRHLQMQGNTDLRSTRNLRLLV
jgi:hypothetical protein